MKFVVFLIFLFLSPYTDANSKPVFIFKDQSSKNRPIISEMFSRITKDIPAHSYKIRFLNSLNPDEVHSETRIFIDVQPKEVENTNAGHNFYFAVPYLNSHSGMAFSVNVPKSIDFLSNLTTINRIVFIHSTYSDSLAKLLSQSAIRVDAIKVNSIQESIRAYQDLFDEKNLSETLVVLPIDPLAYNDEVLLPMIVKMAWKKKLLTYSLNPSNVREGVLLSGIPDIDQMVYEIKGAAFENTMPANRFSKVKTYIFNERVARHFKLKIPDNPELIRSL